MTQQTLLDKLRARTRDNRAAAYALLDLPKTALNYRPGPDRWSALECYAHLNLSLDNYLPEFERCLAAGPPKNSDDYQTGRIGNYLAKMLLPSENMRKLSAPKWMKPEGSRLDKSVLREFIAKQDQLLAILQQSEHTDLRRTKCTTRLGWNIRYQFGDVLRMIAYHNSRHVVQAADALAQYRQTKTAE